MTTYPAHTPGRSAGAMATALVVLRTLYVGSKAVAVPAARTGAGWLDRNGLVVGAYALFAIAAGMIAVPFGLAVAGLGLLLLEVRRER